MPATALSIPLPGTDHRRKGVPSGSVNGTFLPARDSELASALVSYQAGDRLRFGPVLVELMAPALRARLRRYQWLPPAVQPADLAQQLTLELLEAASELTIPEDSRFLGRRLLDHACYRLKRWLACEATVAASLVSFDEEAAR